MPAIDGQEPSLSATPGASRALPTMRDIARLAGVSQSTVSRVLNDTPTRVPIAAETRQRVTDAARTLGYRPNPLARGLRGAPTMLLGAIVRDITDPFFAGAIEALSVEARSRGYNVVLGHAHGRADEALELAAVLETRHCDAIVLLGDMQDQPRLLADLRNSIVPVVAMWQGSSPLEVPTVDVDNRAGIVAGLEHLVEFGHKRIAFIGGRPLGDIREREAAYEEFARERLGGIRDGYVQHAANTPSGGEDALDTLIALPEPPTAIVTSTDTLAVGVLYAAHRNGVAVPRDLSVVGFDDILLASHTIPPLTTVRMPTAEIVRAGVELAIDPNRDGGPSGDGRVRVIAPTLIVRQSTAPMLEREPAANPPVISTWRASSGSRADSADGVGRAAPTRIPALIDTTDPA
jgi:DNA-binding LacI/PurR family transcriptional regulator